MRSEEKIAKKLADLEARWQKEYIEGFEPLDKQEAKKICEKMIEIFDLCGRVGIEEQIRQFNDLLGVPDDFAVGENGRISIDKSKLFLLRLKQLISIDDKLGIISKIFMNDFYLKYNKLTPVLYIMGIRMFMQRMF